MMALTSRPKTINPNNVHDTPLSPPLPQPPSRSGQANETHPRRYHLPPDSPVPPSAARSSTRLRNCTKLTTKILLLLLLLFPAFNVYIGHQIIASDSTRSPPWQTEKDASSHRKIDHSLRRPSNDGGSASAARTRTNRTYPLPKAIPGTSLENLRFPSRVMIPNDISNDVLSKRLKANFPGWDVVTSDPSSCRRNTRTIMREWSVDSSRETILRYIALVEDATGGDLCILVQLYVYGGIFYSGGDDYELSGKGLLRKVTGDTEVLSMVFRDDRGVMEQVLLGAPAGHPVIRRAIEIIIDVLISLGKGNAAASTIMAIEELYNEPAPLNATRLAAKGVYFLSISPPEDITAENSNGPGSAHENPMPNAIVAKAKPKQSAADPEQNEADFEPDIDEETLTPNVTMIRTMLVNGRDDDGNEFPPPMTDLCHAHPVEGSEHDYVKALREAMIHATVSLNSTTVKIAPWNHYGKDKHFAEKTDSLIEVPAPRLMCLVYTVRESHNDKIDAIRNTWAGGCDGFLVFSTTTDLTIPAIAIRHRGPEVYENMWQKVRSLWKYVGEHHLMEEYEWFHLGGDDMFVIPNNLKTYLASLAYTHGSPRTTPYFVGRRFKDLSHNHFNTGGPGYTMSQATLRKFLYNIEANQCSPNLKTPKEDVTISQCLTSLGVHLTDTRDVKGRERYHHFDPGWMMDYTPRNRDVGSPIPQESDWYELYNREWGMLFGADCCAPDSVSFHYVSAGAIRHMHALLHQCHRNETFSRSTIGAHSQTEPHCQWEPVQQPNTTALFRGDASRYRTQCNPIHEDGDSRSASIYTKRLEVVISYCRPDTGFDWIYYDILLQVPKGWNVVLTFISRCSGEKSIPDFREYANMDKVNVINIGNSGGQEYSYAKFINDFMKNPSPAVILFAKERKPIDFDRNNLGGYRNTSEMIDIASNYEFGCGIKPGPKHSWYHDKQTLNDVFLKEWKQPAKAAKSIFNTEMYENLQDFHHRALNYSFPPPKYIPVCYGGSFAIHSQKIIDFFQLDGSRGKGLMELLEHTLSRSGQPIIEELFVERSWAGFFSEPLSAVQESKLGSDIKEIVSSSKPTAGQIKIML